jgi:hypothetical protein
MLVLLCSGVYCIRALASGHHDVPADVPSPYVMLRAADLSGA